MNKAEEDSAPYFRMDRTAFDIMDEGYEARCIEQQLKLTDEERFFAMEFLRSQMHEKGERLDRRYFEIRR